MTQAEICDKLYFDETFKKWFHIGKQANEAQNALVTNRDLDWEFEIKDSEYYFKIFYPELCYVVTGVKGKKFILTTNNELDYFKIGWEHAEF